MAPRILHILVEANLLPSLSASGWKKEINSERYYKWEVREDAPAISTENEDNYEKSKRNQRVDDLRDIISSQKLIRETQTNGGEVWL